MKCTGCGSDLRKDHSLESSIAPVIRNGSRVVEPSCKTCGRLLSLEDVKTGILPTSRALLISGTSGAGKTTVGQFVERRYGYVLVDGDAAMLGLKRRAKTDSTVKLDEYLCHTEVIRTTLVVLGLGYHVVVSYVIELEDIPRYERTLTEFGVTHAIKILAPTRDVCLGRDEKRPCWTGGAEYVDKWYQGFRSMLSSHPNICVDNSLESVEETVQKHIQPWIAAS